MIDLDELAALYEATTPDEWELGDGWIYTDPVYEDDNRLACVHKASTFTDLERQIEERRRIEANLALIVAARNALPELIERVRGLEEAFSHEFALGMDTNTDLLNTQVMLRAAESRVAHLEAGIKALADEWERDRDVCLAWINDESMHVDADHPRRLSDLADRLNRSIEALRALLNGTDKGGE